MAAPRPNTKAYDDDARVRLGLAVIRARQAAGHAYRPSFVAGIPNVSVSSLLKLESGKPVGPDVYEAVARMLPNWTEDTPVSILEDGPIPPTAEVSRTGGTDAKASGTLAEPSRPNRDELLMRYRQLEGVMEIVVDEQRRWHDREEDVRRQLDEIDRQLSAEFSSPKRRNLG